MANTYSLPLWGPYSKKYMGISKILPTLKNEGARLDFSVHPTLWNSSTPVPNVTVPSAYHLFSCAKDYSFYSYRYELMWKDMVYADVSFSKMDDTTYLLRCAYKNNTPLTQNCILNIFASLEFPFKKYVELDTPEKCKVVNANDYDEYVYAKPRPWDTENPDGLFKGMFRDKRFYLSSGLGDRCDNRHVHYYGFKPFGAEKGDRVSFKISGDGFDNPFLAVRYRTVTDGDAEFLFNGKKITLKNSSDLTFAYLPFKENPSFESLGAAGVEFDFLAVLEEGEKISCNTRYYNVKPEIETENMGGPNVARLKYAYDGCEFFILTHNDNTRFRTFESGSLEDALINRLSNGDYTYDDLTETFSQSFERKKSDDGFVQNTLIKSIFVEPGDEHIEYAVISETQKEPLKDEEYEAIYRKAKASCDIQEYNEEGEKYALSTNILRATLLTNAVYPNYLHGENVIHFTPGKRWDSFYTWDSGFIGMGLLEFSKELCLYSLDQYLCDEDNKDFCFLHHGALVPTQFVQYLELLKRTENKAELDFLYEKMKRYYEFLRGRLGSSSCAKFANGLLTTYDYWYSSSGMDDYPAQVEMIKNKAEKYSCPCISTSQVIRAGKILKMVASYLQRNDDIKIYDADIEASTKALNSLAWDEESGYFGYTMYDKDESHPYIMKTEDGENWNKGFDGVYPLIAGAVEGERRNRLISHIKNPNEMWTKAGISAVDTSASYYFDDGYWNGNVWMSHQWFVWKTMLDNADTDFAFEIANRALDMWKEETDFSYFTYECFGIKTRRGGWFHNFGGLSAPICIWADAYYKPGSVTTGFDVWTDYEKTGVDWAEIKFKYFGNNDKYSVIVTLSDKNEYKATLNGKEISFFERKEGCLEFTLDKNTDSGILKVEKCF